MLIDYSNYDSPAEFGYDICFVGAGVAGIIAANELLKKHSDLAILIVESGDGSLRNPHNDNLKDLSSRKMTIKNESREFTFGGATSVWGGLNATFSREEFEREWSNEGEGWPFSYSDLCKYYRMARELYFFEGCIDCKESDVLFLDFSQRSFEARSTPLNYFDLLSGKVDILYNAHVTNIITGLNGRHVESLSVSNIKTQVYSNIKANDFVLSNGAIETSKLLLNSIENGLKIGVERNLIGKFFMNHPKGRAGKISFSINDLDLSNYIGYVKNKRTKFIGLGLPESYREEKRLLNSYIRFEPIPPWENDLLVYKVIGLFRRLKLIKSFIDFRSLKSRVTVSDYSETGDADADDYEYKGFVSSLRNILTYGMYRIFNLSPAVSNYYLRNYLEMEPRLTNRIELGENKDVFGSKKVNVVYQLSQLDKQSLLALHMYLGDWVSQNKLGHVEPMTSKDWDRFTDASHHIGGAIMGTSPNNSVVNQRNQVHSIENLYILGSAVYPSSGSCNPTWTIAAMSIRFADLYTFKLKQAKSPSTGV